MKTAEVLSAAPPLGGRGDLAHPNAKYCLLWHPITVTPKEILFLN
jgi:hypothetical protein